MPITLQQWQEQASQDLKEYFSLPLEIQLKYTPVYSTNLAQFFYLTNVFSKYDTFVGSIARIYEAGRMLTIEDIKNKENNNGFNC